jgi:hypothetical protein
VTLISLLLAAHAARVECKIHICIYELQPVLTTSTLPLLSRGGRNFAHCAKKSQGHLPPPPPREHTLNKLISFGGILRFGARPNNKTPTTTMPFADKTRSLCVEKFLLATLNVCTNDSCCRVRRETVIRACSWFCVLDVSIEMGSLPQSGLAARPILSLTKLTSLSASALQALRPAIFQG